MLGERTYVSLRDHRGAVDAKSIVASAFIQVGAVGCRDIQFAPYRSRPEKTDTSAFRNVSQIVSHIRADMSRNLDISDGYANYSNDGGHQISIAFYVRW